MAVPARVAQLADAIGLNPIVPSWTCGFESHPGHSQVVAAMRELGIDVASQQPQPLTTELAAQADAVITMGCGDACPVIPGRKQLRLDWDLPDPKDRPLHEVRATRDDIDRRVRELVTELDGSAAA